MSELYPEVHWGEGLLLRPQHLQALQRQSQGLLSHYVHTRPFSYGVRDLKISQASIQDYMFELETCDLIMPDGTPVIMDQNAVVPRVNFHEFKTFDGDKLDVYLAIPGRRRSSPGVIDQEAHERGEGTGVRYVSHDDPAIYDENRGTNPQAVGFKRLRVETIVGTRPPGSYSPPLKIAELRRVVIAADDDFADRQSGQVTSYFELSDAFEPAALSIQASPMLRNVLRDLHHKLSTTNTKLATLRHDYRHQALDSAIDLLKLQVTNSVLPVLHQLRSQPLLHPFDVYLQLLRLAGDLAIFTDFDPPDLPVYNHDDPLPAFARLRNQWLKQLDVVSEAVVESDVMKPSGAPGLYELELRPEHVDPESVLYLSIVTDSSAAELEKKFRMGIFKAGDPAAITDPMRKFEHVECRAVDDLPPRMRGRTGLTFLRILKSGDHWEDAVGANRFGVAGDLVPGGESNSNAGDFPRLHVTDKNHRGRG